MIDYLKMLSTALKGEIKTQELFDRNFRVPSFRTIRVENYRNYKIHVDEFGLLFLIQIKVQSEFTMSINQPNKLSSIDRLIEAKNCPYKCYIFKESYNDFITGHKYNPFLSADFQFFWNAFVNHITLWNLSIEEAVAIRENGLFLVLQNNRDIVPIVNDAIELIDDNKNVFNQIQKKSLSAKRIPKDLRKLLPLTKKWSISDDSEREELIEKAGEKEKQKLIKFVDPFLNQINDFLDSFRDQPLSEEAVQLGNLAELVTELKIR